MERRTKHSVAVVIRRDGRILSTHRPPDDDELPGVWGLPAGTCKSGERIPDVIRRIGAEKLGVALTPLRLLDRGFQSRPTYDLDMELWEVSMEGAPIHPDWRWAGIEEFEPGAAKGSLCCELAVKSKSRIGL
jgi:8-oxo-dGTP pyrophosphatase MutT (NUDIX family)